MSININSYSSIASRRGISGLMSGLDTDKIVEGLTSATRSRITRALQNKQILSWKQSAYQDITSDISSMYAKYFRFSSSEDSVMNRNFFRCSSIESSSPYVSATGNSNTIGNVVVRDIQSLARKTSLASSHVVSNQVLEGSSRIYESWEDNAMAGEYLNISYNNEDYMIKVSSDFYIDSTLSDSEKIDGFINELNKQIAKNEDLRGQIEFSLEADGSVSLSETGGTSGDLKITNGSSYILNATGLYEEGVSDVGSSRVTGTHAVSASELYKSNIFKDGSIRIDINGTKTTLNLSSNFKFSKEALQKDNSGNYTDAAKIRQRTELREAFKVAINKNSDLRGKVRVAVEGTDDLEIRFEATRDDGELKIIGGDEALLNNLGITPSSDSDPATKTVSGNINVNDIHQVQTKKLNEVLSGKTITFRFNGVEKTIEFKESEKDQYSNATDVKDYIQNALNKKLGNGKVTVSETGGRLSFETSDPSHTIEVYKSSASGVLQKNGALHIKNNSSNRLDFGKTINEVKDSLAIPLVADSDGNYKISVNGKEFSFSGDTTIGNMISQINSDDEVGIKISYSSIADKFSVEAKTAGANQRIEFAEVGTSNLATALFGTRDDVADGYSVVNGQDFTASISFDGGNTFLQVNRETNTFDMDGVTFEFTGKADGVEEENITFTRHNNVDELVDKVTKFVDTYNKIVEKLQTKVREKRYGVSYDSDEEYLPLTEEQKKDMSDAEIERWEKKAKLGLLQNDSTLENILYNMRRSVTEYVDGEGSLYELGITTGDWKLGGTLIIDEEKLRSEIAKNPDKIANVFTGENGVSERLNKVLKDAVVGNGKNQGSLVSLAGKSSSLNGNNYIGRQINKYKQELKDLKKKLKAQETRWFNKFARLETIVAKYNSQSEYFTSMSQG